MGNEKILAVLSKFRNVDKYESFYEILPSVVHTPEEQKELVSEILDSCCTQLINHFETGQKRCKKAIRQSLIECMDSLSIAGINAENREFGYQLGWFLADKVRVDLKKGTEKKVWGYWQIENNEVKIPVRPRIAPKAKERLHKRQTS